MKVVVVYIVFASIANAQDSCDWSGPHVIPNATFLVFEECSAQGKIKIGSHVVVPSIDFKILHANHPEGNSLWSAVSPSRDTALVWLENERFEREAWILDVTKDDIESFSLRKGNRHMVVQFVGDEDLVVTNAGVGYREDVRYSKTDKGWSENEISENAFSDPRPNQLVQMKVTEATRVFSSQTSSSRQCTAERGR